jgi:hypothetical protein
MVRTGREGSRFPSTDAEYHTTVWGKLQTPLTGSVWCCYA